MIKLSLFFLLAMATSTFAQQADTSASLPKPYKWSFGVSGSYDYCFRYLRTSHSEYEEVIYNRDAEEIPKYGFTTGITALYNFSERLTIESGVYFSDKGERLELIDNQVNSNSPPGLVTGWNITYHYKYLDVPVKVNYYPVKARPRLFVTAGVAANIFLQSSFVNKIEYNDGSSRKSTLNTEGLEPVSLSVLAGFGLEQRIFRPLMFRVEPIYRQFLTSIMDAQVRQYPYSVGLNVSLLYQPG